jgi:hypothetical protein
MVNWVHLEHTRIPDALALALRGKSLAEIGREIGVPSSSLSEENMGDALLVLEALTLALRGERVLDIARKTGIPTSSLYSIRKHGPYEHRNRQRLA